MEYQWSELQNECPIDISRIVPYARNFTAKVFVDAQDIEKAKESLIDARGDLDLMITSLIQLLHDYEILKKVEDVHIFEKLKGDLARFMGRLDDKEDFLLIQEDHRDVSKNRVSTSRISAYAKTLRIASNSIIYESLLKSTKEYNLIVETEEVKKDKRTFLYILFQVLEVTLSVIGSQERLGNISQQKVFNTYSSDYRKMLSPYGQRLIKDDIKEELTKDNKNFDIDKFFGEFSEDDAET